ncbi:MAG: hypothetical protein OEZ23_06255 [Gammaproteobacteria bacterium]|nr:hypothetical protein [Gammaproteobacteria bacterium]
MKDGLILGVDGGGSKTAANIARVNANGDITLLGSGYGGAGNACAVGLAQAEDHLNTAIGAARQSAGLTANEPIDVAVLALAGSTITEVRTSLLLWMQKTLLADRAELVHDADPVIAEGLPEGRGVAMIIGTGSVAISTDGKGKRSVVGGWGHWFGDTGSGYDLGRSALAALAATVDGLGPETVLVEAVLNQFSIHDPRQVLGALGHSGDIHREIATLAPTVLRLAEAGDNVALAIVESAASTAAKLVQAAASHLALEANAPLALAGGVAASSDYYRQSLLRALNAIGRYPVKVTVVNEPVKGTLVMAKNFLLNERHERRTP